MIVVQQKNYKKQLPNAKVIKAFNTTLVSDFDSPIINKQQVDVFIAGNEEESLKTVSELVTVAGFNPVVAGDLTVSRTLEAMYLLLAQLSKKYNYKNPAGWKVLHN